jgi:predicted transcriptional regulator
MNNITNYSINKINNSILLSIKPLYVEKIISGEKIFEYRRKIPVNNIDFIALYSTYPVQKILAIAHVIGRISDEPAKLWYSTQFGGSISKILFDEYFKGVYIAHALKLGEVIKLKEPLSLNLINDQFRYPPQSFRYLYAKELQIILDQLPQAKICGFNND